MLDADQCYAAILRRDPAADGLFFVAVRSTGIYCRPICPARAPLRRNVTFYRTAAAAQTAGYRPCLRCRPESAPASPAWIGSLASINRALRLIDDGVLVESSVEELAAHLGMTGRHLHRLFIQHVGASPVAIEQARRIHLAQKLLHETTLPITEIALAAGFGSVRRFNEVMLAMFKRPPSDLRRRSARHTDSASLSVSLAFRPPLTWSVLAGAATRSGLVCDDDLLHLPLNEYGASTRASVSPTGPRTLSVTLTNVPLRDVGAAIAKIKRRILGGFQPEESRRYASGRREEHGA